MPVMYRQVYCGAQLHTIMQKDIKAPFTWLMDKPISIYHNVTAK